ncbi:MAG: site-specific DNA-methyltransferase [Actinobacteria bacterium]|nr:site-specific DNA-methyltransferase [Actinomycetota bacterium]
MKKRKDDRAGKQVESFIHEEAVRKNIPPAEYQSLLSKEQESPIRVAYERRNRDLDPQLVWRGKDEQDWSDLVVHAPPIYIQEKVHPKVLIDDLMRRHNATDDEQLDLFADFNGLPSEAAKTEFYQHDGNWSNRMILGDSLQVMASLAEREGLRGQVQCIYIDPPYGIKFNSNFQWSTTSRDVKDGKADHITREPEQVKAFRDTWRDGIHTYLTYLRDRLCVCRDLLGETGSVFVQIGNDNLHRVRLLLDEVFGEENFVSMVQVQKTGSQASRLLANTVDFILWYAKTRDRVKYRPCYGEREAGHASSDRYDQIELAIGVERRLSKDELARTVDIPEGRIFQHTSLVSSGATSSEQSFQFRGIRFEPGPNNHWKTTVEGLARLGLAGRLAIGRTTIRYKRYLADFALLPLNDRWESLQIGTGLTYVVETAPSVIQRCIIMTTDPGDLVLDPTCGSGTTAYVAEQWGRRWITVDTSRVALALARARIMGARYPYFLLVDSAEGRRIEIGLGGSPPDKQAMNKSIRQGFVYERLPRITLKAIANNAEIDVIWDKWQATLEPLRETLNMSLGTKWLEWDVPLDLNDNWPDDAKQAHAAWWAARIARQMEIDESISARADFEYLYDKPYEDRSKVRVAGPFTVESLAPHRVLIVNEDDELVDGVAGTDRGAGGDLDFAQMILENLKVAGVQQAHKEDKIVFTSLTPWPGNLICAEGRYIEGGEEGAEKRAAVFIGPEFGTVSRPDLVAAAREAGDADFDVLIACAFSYDAHSSEFDRLGRLPVLKARMNADLHMADDLKNTGKGNLFVIFGEPDIDILDAADNQIQVRIKGVDVFHPSTGEVRSDGPEGIACWFIDTDYNEESFFVRHAYFLGANDPYKALKTTLKAEIDQEAWESLHSDISRPFDKPESGRIAVKVINHLGDEVMKVFRV